MQGKDDKTATINCIFAISELQKVNKYHFFPTYRFIHPFERQPERTGISLSVPFLTRRTSGGYGKRAAAGLFFFPSNSHFSFSKAFRLLFRHRLVHLPSGSRRSAKPLAHPDAYAVELAKITGKYPEEANCRSGIYFFRI